VTFRMSEDRGDGQAIDDRRGTGPGLVKRRTNPLLLVAVVLVAMLSYYFLIAWRGFYLIMEDRWILKALGIAVLVLPLIGAQVVLAKLRFGVACQLLVMSMRDEGKSLALPALPRLPSGRKDRRAAEAWREQQREAVQQEPQDWRAWFRLAQAHDLAGDPKRAREALRTAIEKRKQGR
jgi:hypothetical protein